MSFWSSITNFFTSAINLFSSPQATQAAQNIIGTVEEVDKAIVCAIAAGSGLASSIMSQVKAGDSVSGTTEEIHVISSAVCSALGGTVVGTTSGAPVLALASVSKTS